MVAPLVGLVIVQPFVSFPLFRSIPGLDAIVVALLGSLLVAPFVGRLVLGEWVLGAVRAGAVMAIAMCACGGIIHSPIEGLFHSPSWPGIPPTCAALLTGTLAGGVLLRRPRPIADEDTQRPA